MKRGMMTTKLLQITLIAGTGPRRWERADEIVRVLVTVDIGSSEGQVI